MRKLLLLAFAGLMFLCGCERKEQPISTTPSSGSVALVDDGPPLSMITKILPIGRDSILVTDRSFQLQLFVSYRFEKILGKKGKGPGEYSSIRDLQRNGDTLFVFDRRLGKIVGYSLQTNEMLCEFVNAHLSQFDGFLRVNGIFYFGFSTYTGEPKPDKSLLFQLDEHNELRELKFHYSDLGSDKIVFASSPSAPVRMRAKDSLIYIIWPFSSRMWIYDLVKNTVESFKLDLEYPEQTDLRDVRDLQTESKILEHIEMVLDFFLLQDRVVLWSAKLKFRTPPTKETSKLRFYTYLGEELGNFNVSPFVWSVEDSVFARMQVDTSESGDRHPYRITWEKYRM